MWQRRLQVPSRRRNRVNNMIARLEQAIFRFRRFFSRSKWLVKLLKLAKTEEGKEETGLILVQIDGLARVHMEKAIFQGRLPFLQDLMDKQHYDLKSLYSGLPSSTPAVQAELFYGVKSAVPAFAFYDHYYCRIFRMIEPEDALAMEKRLKKRGRGLLEGGSSYSNIYTGGADEAHFCASNMGWDTLFEKGSPLSVIIFFILHIPSFIRTIFLLIIEFILAFTDMFRGLISGKDLWKEIKFIPSRIGVTILARELIIAGISMDIIRNRKIISCNFIGYDEQAHRRGPSSAFAYWGLGGIDNAVRRIWNIAQKSPFRHYEIWVFSDHGQEDVLSYQEIAGMTVQQAVAKVFDRYRSADSVLLQEKRGIQGQRVRHLGYSYIEGFLKRRIEYHLPEDLKGPIVTAMGPLGFIYTERHLEEREKMEIAGRLVGEAGIPSVFVKDNEGRVIVWNSSGKWILPDDALNVIGKDHPFLETVAADLIDLVNNRDAGEFVLSGWEPGKQPLSFPSENGSHAGPGNVETEGFILAPSDSELDEGNYGYLRPEDLRKGVLEFLGRSERTRKGSEITYSSEIREFRVMTYNVHSCIGLDGRVSPERIARVIARYEPDVVALQELDVNLRRTGGVDQPLDIARSLAMDHHFHPPIIFEEEEYGDAILSRLPMKMVKAGDFESYHGHRGEKRGAIWVRIEIGGKEINLVNTHLGFRKHSRASQLLSLAGTDWLDHPDCHGPIILCGDFNAFPSSRTYRMLRKKFLEVQTSLRSRKPEKTFYSRYPLGRIDYIFYSPHFIVKDFKVPYNSLTRIASDHLPVIADLEILH